jgi:glycosyltransferase involved in cell wall biosynthesis
MPSVSVIVPCFNEENTIYLLLDALYAQTYPRAEMQVIIADGMSTDHTRERIAAFHQMHADLQIKVVDNPAGTIPTGLNRAIAAADGEFIVRLDAHSVPQPDYVARCQHALEQGLGDNVGGVWEIRPRGSGWQARSIAVAAAHPLGVGDAYYRYADCAQSVDTVPFGAFRRSLVEKVGYFDESLLTNEDYEFNTRVRQSGGTIWLEPAIRSIYFSRDDLAGLARQYWRYGYWKARMLSRYPESLRWRQALPPFFVLTLFVGLLGSFWVPAIRWVFVLELTAYILVLLLAGIQRGIKHRDMALIFGVPLAIATMHLTWGSAFLWSLMFK